VLCVRHTITNTHTQVQLAGQFDQTLNLAGEVVVQLAASAAIAVKAAQASLDARMPGPDAKQVLAELK
jgi:hypothetical protein